MQTSQTKINQEVAVALERLNGRMESLEHWRNEQDEMRMTRETQQPHLDRATLAIIISAIMVVIYALAFIAPHWH